MSEEEVLQPAVRPELPASEGYTVNTRCLNCGDRDSYHLGYGTVVSEKPCRKCRQRMLTADDMPHSR